MHKKNVVARLETLQKKQVVTPSLTPNIAYLEKYQYR
jgi:hypothetical protein